MLLKRAPRECCLCTQPSFCFGRCPYHYAEARRDPIEWKRLHELTSEERAADCQRLKHPPIPKWEYENPSGEEYLARLCEQRQHYLDTHPDAPMLMTWDDVDALIEAEDQESN
jgi:hypothetical protein